MDNQNSTGAQPRKDKKAPHPVVLFLRLWQIVAWGVFILGLLVMMASVYQTFLGEGSFSFNGRVVTDRREALLYQFAFLLAWIGVFSIVLWFTPASALKRPGSAKPPARKNPIWTVTQNELALQTPSWPAKIIASALLLGGGSLGLYYQLLKPWRTAAFGWGLTPGLIFLNLIFLGLIFLGYRVLCDAAFTRFNLASGAYVQRSGAFPFSRLRKGNTREDLLQVRLAPSGQPRAFPGDENWDLAFLWKEPCGTTRQQDLLSKSGVIREGRNTAEVELETIGRELAGLLHVPFAATRAWWSHAPLPAPQTSPAPASVVDLTDSAALPCTPLPNLGYSSPLSHRFRKLGPDRARIGPAALAPSVFVFTITALFSFVPLLDWTTGYIQAAFYSSLAGLCFAVFIALFFLLGFRTTIDLRKGKITVGASNNIEVDVSRVRAIQICDAGHTNPSSSADGPSHSSAHIFQLILVEEGDPLLRHGILAGDPLASIEKIGHQLASFLSVPLIQHPPSRLQGPPGS